MNCGKAAQQHRSVACQTQAGPTQTTPPLRKCEADLGLTVRAAASRECLLCSFAELILELSSTSLRGAVSELGLNIQDCFLNMPEFSLIVCLHVVLRDDLNFMCQMQWRM